MTSSVCRCSSTTSAAASRRAAACCTLDDLHDARRVAAAIGFPHYIVNFEQQFREHRHLELRARVRLRADAAALRALQQRSEVLDAARSRARASAPSRSQPATTRASSSDARRPLAAEARRRPGEGSVVLPVLADAGSARARASFPSATSSSPRCATQARRLGLAGRRQAGQPGDLLHSRRRLRGVRGAEGSRTWRAPARSSTRTDRRSARTPASIASPSASARAWASASSSPLYVLKIDADAGTVMVGSRDALEQTRLTASGVNWVSIDAPDSPVRVSAQIRHRHKPAAGFVRALPDGGAEMTFDEPQPAITPGQAVVFYDRDVVVGGGWIDSEIPNPKSQVPRRSRRSSTDTI